jgi:molybdopterin converting factor small subunit
MSVKIRYRAHLAGLTKTGEEQAEAATVKEVLEHIGKRFGAQAKKTARSMIIAVNGESILHLDLFNTVLHDGDEVSFLPICGGG